MLYHCFNIASSTECRYVCPAQSVAEEHLTQQHCSMSSIEASRFASLAVLKCESQNLSDVHDANIKILHQWSSSRYQSVR